MGNIFGDLRGIYQEKNANTILAAIKILGDLGFVAEISEDNNPEKNTKEIKQGFAHVAEYTGLMGRWQKIKEAPQVVCDTGHNTGGWAYLSKQLSSIECKHLHIIFGMLNDKDCQSVISMLPKNATYYFAKPDTKRGMDADVIEELARLQGLQGNRYGSVKEAYKAAMYKASHNDFIFVGGSTYIVAEFLKDCI
jgi:dihydrofolate synthase/folylpolyglutamate synthase